MFKFLVVILLCIIAFHSFASTAIVTMHVNDSSYVFICSGHYHDLYKVPFNLPLWYWKS